MRILNVRYDFANNSSSSHSVILLKGGAADHDTGSFQWNAFTLGSETAKLRYLAAQAALNFPKEAKTSEGWPRVDETNPLFRDIIGLIFGRVPTQEELTELAHGQAGEIDHQSVWALPVGFDGTPHTEFLRQLREVLLKEDVVVLGGNDNSDGHSLYEEGAEILGALPRERAPAVARYDTEGDFWTLFDPVSGLKTRFSFEEQVGRRERRNNPPLYEKAMAPELVDLKITGFCEAGCAYCYQSSTPRGEHAPLERVLQIIEALSKLQVFEVALGGGEPTEHPHFVEIMQALRAAGIKANFTTKSLRWLKPDNGNTMSILKAMGSFAYSAETAEDVRALGEVLDAADVPAQMRSAIAVQHVLGTVPEEKFTLMALATAHLGLRLTLLGYKTTGFGKRVTPHAVSWPRALIKATEVLNAERQLGREHRSLSISIDTALAKQSEAELAALQVPRWMYHTKEGAFSMYIDAVKGTAAASSYEGRPEKVELTAEALRARFATY